MRALKPGTFSKMIAILFLLYTISLIREWLREVFRHTRYLAVFTQGIAGEWCRTLIGRDDGEGLLR